MTYAEFSDLAFRAGLQTRHCRYDHWQLRAPNARLLVDYWPTVGKFRGNTYNPETKSGGAYDAIRAVEGMLPARPAADKDPEPGTKDQSFYHAKLQEIAQLTAVFMGETTVQLKGADPNKLEFMARLIRLLRETGFPPD